MKKMRRTHTHKIDKKKKCRTKSEGSKAKENGEKQEKKENRNYYWDKIKTFLNVNFNKKLNRHNILIHTQTHSNIDIHTHIIRENVLLHNHPYGPTFGNCCGTFSVHSLEEFRIFCRGKIHGIWLTLWKKMHFRSKYWTWLLFE